MFKMGFSPKVLIKSTFRKNTNSSSIHHNPSSPSTSNGSSFYNLMSKNINHVQPIYMSSSYSSVRIGSNSSNSGDLSHTKATTEVLTIIAKQKICVVRKYGADEETLVNIIKKIINQQILIKKKYKFLA